MTARSFYLPEEVEQYIFDRTVREAPVMRELREETATLPGAGMQTGPDQVQFLQWLVHLIGARRCIEVGVYTGYSALGVALALPQDGTIVACDVNESYTQVARRYWRRAGVEKKIDLRIAPASETLDELLARGEAGSFDFAYIDADKSGYDAYYERCLRLIRDNGVIAIDNVLWSGDVARSDVTDPDTIALQKLNDKIARDERVESSLLSIGDGLTLARKR
jgi:predicted O-methyltransferase YrrM